MSWNILFFVLLSKLLFTLSVIPKIMVNFKFLFIKTNRTESDQGGVPGDSVTLMSPEAGPISILRNSLLALQLLPGNASAGIQKKIRK